MQLHSLGTLPTPGNPPASLRLQASEPLLRLQFHDNVQSAARSSELSVSSEGRNLLSFAESH